MTGMFSQMNLLGNALRGADQQHRAISQNIANANTPGYKTQRIDFDELVETLGTARAENETLGLLPVETVDGLAERVDGNNVDMEREVSALKKNALVFQAYSQLMASKLQTMRRAITS